MSYSIVGWDRFYSRLGQLSLYSYSLRLDGPGNESRQGRDFLHPSRPALGSTHEYWIFPGGKAVLTTSIHLAPRLKEEQSYTSSHPLGHQGLFYDEFLLLFYVILCVSFSLYINTFTNFKYIKIFCLFFLPYN